MTSRMRKEWPNAWIAVAKMESDLDGEEGMDRERRESGHGGKVRRPNPK